MSTKELSIAQISDSHLFAESTGLHCGQNVYANLLRVLTSIKTSQFDLIVFTGDLTQDHTLESYRRFDELLETAEISIPVYPLCGNHDDPEMMKQGLKSNQVNFDKTLESEHWQLLLLNSKSDTPAGYVEEVELSWLDATVQKDKHQLTFMHHHPEDIGYFIDRHGLLNQQAFWQGINRFPSIKGIACGHVHRGSEWIPEQSANKLTLYTCPATSIQFDPERETLAALPIGPGYRKIDLFSDGKIETQLIYLELAG